MRRISDDMRMEAWQVRHAVAGLYRNQGLNLRLAVMASIISGHRGRHEQMSDFRTISQCFPLRKSMLFPTRTGLLQPPSQRESPNATSNGQRRYIGGVNGQMPAKSKRREMNGDKMRQRQDSFDGCLVDSLADSLYVRRVPYLCLSALDVEPLVATPHPEASFLYRPFAVVIHEGEVSGP